MGPLEVGCEEETASGSEAGRSASGGGGRRHSLMPVDKREGGRGDVANRNSQGKLLGILTSLLATAASNIKGLQTKATRQTTPDKLRLKCLTECETFDSEFR